MDRMSGGNVRKRVYPFDFSHPSRRFLTTIASITLKYMLAKLRAFHLYIYVQFSTHYIPSMDLIQL